MENHQLKNQRRAIRRQFFFHMNNTIDFFCSSSVLKITEDVKCGISFMTKTPFLPHFDLMNTHCNLFLSKVESLLTKHYPYSYLKHNFPSLRGRRLKPWKEKVSLPRRLSKEFVMISCPTRNT